MADNDRRVGKTLAGKYLIKRLLGEGSMGAVFEGTHLEIGKRVAIKLMNPDYADSPDIVKRFRREARAASAVDSDYIVQVFDAGADEELGVFMVTELLVGEDLESRLTREGRLEPSLAVLIAYQASRGLAKAHAAGVIHRDLKPANIFLAQRDDESLLTKILDFGISKVLAGDEGPQSRADGSLTQAGMALGTPQYMSPEQAQALPNIDARTDVWSLATVLYEALAGRPAFGESGSFFDVMMSVVRDPVPPLLDVAPWVPPAVADVVHAALVKDPNARIADAATFGRKLLQALPDASLNTSGRFSMPDISGMTRALPVPAPPPPDDDTPHIEASVISERAPRSTPLDIERSVTTDDDIPVSVSFDSAPSDLPPATVREPGLIDDDDNAATLAPPPPAPSVPPPSSSTDDKVQVFHRDAFTKPAADRDRDKKR